MECNAAAAAGPFYFIIGRLYFFLTSRDPHHPIPTEKTRKWPDSSRPIIAQSGKERKEKKRKRRIGHGRSFGIRSRMSYWPMNLSSCSISSSCCCCCGCCFFSFSVRAPHSMAREYCDGACEREERTKRRARGRTTGKRPAVQLRADQTFRSRTDVSFLLFFSCVLLVVVVACVDNGPQLAGQRDSRNSCGGLATAAAD